jgi:hypothetical protein
MGWAAGIRASNYGLLPHYMQSANTSFIIVPNTITISLDL